MKKKVLSVSFVLALLLFAVNTAFAAATFDGVYGEVGDASSVAVYSQDGNTVNVTGYYVINGQPRVWYGRGKREGDTISYSYKITLGPSRLAAERKNTGKHTLTISPDGRTMTGTSTASDGTSSSFTMQRKSN
ncbi:MAG: hypothetical protein CSYNP_01983 [Syntrophus sp. SKADARSKE-3]|nr:hypothetical protein [Syntrophus sp. SKADARSKE-3]